MTRPVGEQSDTKLAVLLFMMWSRLGIPCLYDACVYRAKNSDEVTMASGGFTSGNQTNLKLIGAVLLLFRWLPIVGN